MYRRPSFVRSALVAPCIFAQSLLLLLEIYVLYSMRRALGKRSCLTIAFTLLILSIYLAGGKPTFVEVRTGLISISNGFHGENFVRWLLSIVPFRFAEFYTSTITLVLSFHFGQMAELQHAIEIQQGAAAVVQTTRRSIRATSAS